MLRQLALIVQLVNTVHSLDNKLKQRAKHVQQVNTVQRLDEARVVTIAGQANTMTRILKLHPIVKYAALGNTTMILLASLFLIAKLVLPENTMTKPLKPTVNHALQGNTTSRRAKHQ